MKKNKKKEFSEKKLEQISEWFTIIFSVLAVATGFIYQASKLAFLLTAIGLVILWITYLLTIRFLKKKFIRLMKIENRVIKQMAQVVNYIFNSSEVKINPHDFSYHKNYDSAQESRLVQGDTITIIAANLDYDLDEDSGSIRMIAESLLRGVKYNYFVENNGLCQKQVPKLYNNLFRLMCGICKNNPKYEFANPDESIKTNLCVRWLEDDKFLYNFVYIYRPGTASRDHCGFYFVKQENGKGIIYETLFDSNDEIIGKFMSIVDNLQPISIPYFGGDN